MEIHELGAVELRDAIRARELSSVEATQHFLDRIDRLDDCGAFVDVTPELALERAAACDESEPKGVIHGMPLADKDLNLRAGTVTTFGSRAFEGVVAPESDALTKQLDAAGAVSLGKTAVSEFGFHAHTSTLAHGTTTVPGHPDRHAGGSSGGAAAAVAAGLLPFAPGSDAGGSIRIPAAACGLVGLKPSRGRVQGLSGLGRLGQLPVAGPIARSVEDAALLLDAMIERRDGRPLHRTALRSPALDEGSLLAAARPGGRRRVGVLRDCTPWGELVDTPSSPEAEEALQRGIALLAGAGHAVEEFQGPTLPGYSDAFVTLWHANAAAMALDDDQLDLLEPMSRSFVESGRRLGPKEIVGAVGRMHAHEQTVIEAFDRYDVVITPTTAMSPRPIGWYTDDPDTNFRRQCQYVPHLSFVNVAGLPALTVPVLTLPDGLTMGLHLIGRPGDEATLLSVGAELELLVG